MEKSLLKLTSSTLKRINLRKTSPVGPRISVSMNEAKKAIIPKSLNELPQAISRAYDLSITSASELNIPVIASVSGGYKRRVIVLERTAFKKISQNKEKHLYGYAIRLCLTVNKWEANFKTNLSFLAASAELGHLRAEWTLQIMGLAGPKIDEALIAPQELNLKTFVLAQQSLSKLIKAINDNTTKFIPILLAIERPRDSVDKDYKIAVAKVYALHGLEKGWNIKKAIRELKTGHDEMIETIGDVYKVAGITDPDSKPDKQIRNWAKGILNRILISLRK